MTDWCRWALGIRAGLRWPVVVWGRFAKAIGPWRQEYYEATNDNLPEGMR